MSCTSCHPRALAHSNSVTSVLVLPQAVRRILPLPQLHVATRVFNECVMRLILLWHLRPSVVGSLIDTSLLLFLLPQCNDFRLLRVGGRHPVLLHTVPLGFRPFVVLLVLRIGLVLAVQQPDLVGSQSSSVSFRHFPAGCSQTYYLDIVCCTTYIRHRTRCLSMHSCKLFIYCGNGGGNQYSTGAYEVGAAQWFRCPLPIAAISPVGHLWRWF